MYFWELKVTPNRPLHLWNEVSFYQLAIRAELINMWCFVTRLVGRNEISLFEEHTSVTVRTAGLSEYYAF